MTYQEADKLLMEANRCIVAVEYSLSPYDVTDPDRGIGYGCRIKLTELFNVLRTKNPADISIPK